MVEFLTWWFVTHWLWATFLTPGLTFLYAVFTHSTGWAWACGLLYVAYHATWTKA